MLGLLEEYVAVCDLWEDHNRRAADKGFANLKEEKAAHQAIQTEEMLPFMEKCDRAGFRYIGFISIIPPAFETSAAQRWAMLEDLEMFMKKEFPA